MSLFYRHLGEVVFWGSSGCETKIFQLGELTRIEGHEAMRRQRS
jgi:hypothetical protein